MVQKQYNYAPFIPQLSFIYGFPTIVNGDGILLHNYTIIILKNSRYSTLQCDTYRRAQYSTFSYCD